MLASLFPTDFAANLTKIQVVVPLVLHQVKDNAALKAAGAEPKLTIYPDAMHDSWTVTYDNPELYTWFLEHKRKKPDAEKTSAK